MESARLTAAYRCGMMRLYRFRVEIRKDGIPLTKRIIAVWIAAALVVSLTSCGEAHLPASSTAEPSISHTDAQTTVASSTTGSSCAATTIETESRPPATQATTRDAAPSKPPSTGVTSRTTTKERSTTSTTPSAQKAATFTFSQTFPLEITSYGARFQILDASISAVQMDAEGGCTFDFICQAKRLEDGIAGKKTCAVRVIWFNEAGEQVKATGPAVGSLEVGETGSCRTAIGMKPVEMQGSPNGRFTVRLEGYGEA